MSEKKYYAVKVGRETGIFESWEECQKQIINFSGAVYKKFTDLKAAEKFLYDNEVEENTSDDLSGLHAYVDGSFSSSLQETGYGAVILYNGEIVHTISGKSKKYIDMRNVAGELFATGMAVKWAVDNGYKEITLHHDYSGIASWAKGEWKTKQEGTINYKNYMDSLKDKIVVKFIKVKSHSGDLYNDMADELAKKALDIIE